MTEAPLPRLLILDDDADVATAARLLLRRRFSEVMTLQQPGGLLAAIERFKPDLLLLDLNFAPGEADGAHGLTVLRQLAARRDAPAVIAMTAYAEVDLAVQALQLGAVDFVTKPWDNARMVASIAAALARRAPASAAGSPLLGGSPAMQALRAQIASVAPTEANVLILGENGVGKELVAQAVHQASKRTAGPFLAVDMGTLPASTFESELFGHRAGSFTDARQARAGRFQAARGGTLFLDEIGNLPLPQQAKLLTALERRQVTPLGADTPEAVDVRIVSATNLPEAGLFDPQQFRADLLWRLNTIVLRVPPLRDRPDDVLPLAAHYLALYARQHGKPLRGLSEAAAQVLQGHDWPGNVRALRHACERASILATGSVLQPEDFALPLHAVAAVEGKAPLHLARRERDAVAAALAQAQGNISQAAKLLGVSRAALYRRLEKHGL
ncbi:sigma-54 dependent transcriptional regulator [Ideonella azotifigens]|nr:sigma-54 dependent transcriptional regulator [Ideonella azotifigens]MCD2344798.1 sigma-54 dependent transcriptional regulator [Ideonella azotifigens]